MDYLIKPVKNKRKLDELSIDSNLSEYSKKVKKQKINHICTKKWNCNIS